jgi:hypothetical protein
VPARSQSGLDEAAFFVPECAGTAAACVADGWPGHWRGTCGPVVSPPSAGTAGIAIRRILNDYSIGISLPKP